MNLTFGNLLSLSDVIALLSNWQREVPDKCADRWQVTPLRKAQCGAVSGQFVPVDTTGADVKVILEPATRTNVGRSVVVRRVAGANDILVSVRDGGVINGVSGGTMTTTDATLVACGADIGWWSK